MNDIITPQQINNSLNEIKQDVTSIKRDFVKTNAILKLHIEEWLDNQDVCLKLKISKRKLQTMRDNGTIPYSKINRKIYYKISDIIKLLESNYTNS